MLRKRSSTENKKTPKTKTPKTAESKLETPKPEQKSDSSKLEQPAAIVLGGNDPIPTEATTPATPKTPKKKLEYRILFLKFEKVFRSSLRTAFHAPPVWSLLCFICYHLSLMLIACIVRLTVNKP